MLRIGTSGWHYKDWRGIFYPEKMPAKAYLDYYASHFDTVELNGVFYRLPTTEAVKEWYRVTPPTFLFAYKGSRFITHMKKLNDAQDALKTMLKQAALLKEKLSVILWQLPPFFTVNTNRLRDFLRLLPKDTPHVMEFRHPSWYTPEIFELLKTHHVGLCLHDMKGSVSPLEVTSNMVYVRFHGTGEKKYHGGYSDDQLKDWAQRIQRWRKTKKDVYVYFNNDYYGMAINNAKTLLNLIDSGHPKTP
jgi:uncharacterized protein YecE (DUF72 family)